MREKNKNTPARVRFLKPCVHPEVGSLLPDYIIDLLSDDAAEEVEEHLLACGHCREDYLNILSLRAAAGEMNIIPAATSAPQKGGADIRRISDYKK